MPRTDPSRRGPAARAAAVSLAAAGLLAACATGPGSGPSASPVPEAATAAAASAVAPAAPAALPQPAAPDYRLQVGDKIELRFFYTPQLNETQRVRPDGRISLQLVGEAQAAGLRVPEFESALQARYAKLLRRPEVSVNLQEFSPPRVYVGGEVLRPGTLELRGSVTTIQSIMSAGGFTPDAKVGTVVVLRYGDAGQPEYLQLDLTPPFNDPARQDLVLQPFDVVYVPKTQIASVADFFSRYVNNIIPLYRNLGVSVLYNLNKTTLEVKP